MEAEVNHPSPLARPGEEDHTRIKRLLQTGTAEECLIEANHWLDYYLDTEEGELEPVSTALALNTRALALIGSQETIGTKA